MDIQLSVVALSFAVFAIPPSAVTCYTDDVTDDVTITIVARQYPEVAFGVTVTMATRVGGAYYCTVVAVSEDEILYNITTEARYIPGNSSPTH